MKEPRRDVSVVTPQEAQHWRSKRRMLEGPDIRRLIATVATEPERTRAVVVDLLRTKGREFVEAASGYPSEARERGEVARVGQEFLAFADEWDRADAIENGADL